MREGTTTALSAVTRRSLTGGAFVATRTASDTITIESGASRTGVKTLAIEEYLSAETRSASSGSSDARVAG